jgi:hypothetical protein
VGHMRHHAIRAVGMRGGIVKPSCVFDAGCLAIMVCLVVLSCAARWKEGSMCASGNRLSRQMGFCAHSSAGLALIEPKSRSATGWPVIDRVLLTVWAGSAS